MIEFLALLCWWVAVGCGETATHIWDLPKGEAVVVSQEVQSATGTLMERPAPILGVNFCKRSEYAHCWEWAGEPHFYFRDGVAVPLDPKYRWEIRVHNIARRGVFYPDMADCYLAVAGVIDFAAGGNTEEIQASEWRSVAEGTSSVPISLTGCAAGAVEARLRP